MGNTTVIPKPQHCFCPQSQQLGPHHGGLSSGIWCERCRRAGHEAEMCAARIPRSLPHFIGSHCYRTKPFVRHYSGGDGTALSLQQQPAPRPFSSFGWEQMYNGGHSTALSPQQQAGPRPFSSCGWEQRNNGDHSTALSPQQQPGLRPFSSFSWEQRYNGGHSAALSLQQQPGPRPFSSFGWEQRYNGGHSAALSL